MVKLAKASIVVIFSSGHQEKLLGTLEPGKKADFIILDRDMFAIDESEIWQIEVRQTWVNGQRVTD